MASSLKSDAPCTVKDCPRAGIWLFHIQMSLEEPRLSPITLCRAHLDLILSNHALVAHQLAGQAHQDKLARIVDVPQAPTIVGVPWSHALGGPPPK